MTAYWAVELRGEATDLAEFERAVRPEFDPWVEHVDGKVALRSAEFDTLANAADISGRARVLIDMLNGAASITRGSYPVHPGVILQVMEDGKVHQTITGVGNMKLRNVIGGGTVTVTNPDGSTPPPTPPIPTEAQAWVQRSIKDTRIADLLVFLGRADNWFDIYKAIEMAEALVGGKHELPPLLGASAGAFANVRRTANTHRHAPLKNTPPSNPATLEEAQVLVKYAVQMALDHTK